MPREVHFYLLEDYFHLDEIFCLESRLCWTFHWKMYPYHQDLLSGTIDYMNPQPHKIVVPSFKFIIFSQFYNSKQHEMHV